MGTPLTFLEVLYEFDGPMIFVGQVGLFRSFFVKTDEYRDSYEYISCYIDQERIDALKDGRLSVRGVFDCEDEKYIVIMNLDFTITSTEIAATPAHLVGRLPDSGVGIYPCFGQCPDVMQQKDSLLTVYFKGKDLNRKAIEYSALMSMLSKVQSLARNVLVPPLLRGLRSATFDFLVADPALGSFMISIKKPTADLRRLRQGKERRNMTLGEVTAGVEATTEDFFDGVNDLVSDGAKAGLSIEEDEIFASVQDLLPSEDTPYSEVTFSTQRGGTLRRVSITRATADAIRGVHERPGANSTRRSGSIVEINAASRTLLLKSRVGNVTTCSFDQATFDILKADPDFKIGSRMLVSGELTQRVRRDYLVVASVHSIQAASAN